MQHPWRQREHPFSSDLMALIFWFSQCTRYWLRADTTLSVSAVCHPCPMAGSPMPAVLLPPPPLCPYRGGPLLPFWQHGRLCPGRHSQHKVFPSYVSFCICFFQRGRQLHGFTATGLAQSFQVSIRSSISDVNRRSR